MTYYIRDIQEKDNQEVEYVIRSCLIEFHGDHKGTAWCDPHLGSFYQFYQLEKSHYWVIEDEKGHVVGGAGIGPLCLKDNVCELQKMYCLPEVRGTGIAYQLMEIALNYARLYYRYCYIETLDNMVRAQRFYEKFGFIRIDKPLYQTSHTSRDVRYIKNLQEKK